MVLLHEQHDLIVMPLPTFLMLHNADFFYNCFMISLIDVQR